MLIYGVGMVLYLVCSELVEFFMGQVWIYLEMLCIVRMGDKEEVLIQVYSWM